ncbi:MAG: C10 family peptidase [Tidjanibacter sp.]|nr:C10 family peptidase [Tidjanibacter sp.]
MNRFRHLLLLALLGLITACSYNELPENLSPLTIENDGLVLQVETRAETYKGQSLDQEYFVTAADLENFVKYRRIASKRSDLTVKEVKSYGFDSSQTLFYILNYDKGWEVISADKRIQPTLAHGDSGEFTMDSDNEAMKFWMNMLADGILRKRQTYESNITRAALHGKEVDYVLFWNMIGNANQQLFIDDHSTKGTYGYLVETENIPRTDTYGNELNTEWGQNYPWNAFCPYTNDSHDEYAPAGCVAVAGAQAIYYLRDHFQMDDATAPLAATCTGTIDSYLRIFDNLSTATWTYMAETETDGTLQNRLFSARFIAYIGHLVGVDYGEDSSSASTTHLRERVFDFYGISSVLTEEFNLSIIKQNVENNLPVVIRGKDAMLFGSGHSWVIDQYRRDVVDNIKYYAIFSSPQTDEYISTLDKSDATRCQVTTTVISETLHMNWGWAGVNNGWFATIPDDWWLKDSDGDDFRFKYYIRMIHDFSID